MKQEAIIKIEGSKALLMHGFRASTLKDAKTRKGTIGDNPSEWENTVLMDSSRRPYVLGSYIVAAIKRGGKTLKAGRGTLEKKIESTLECNDDLIFFEGLKVPTAHDLSQSPVEPVYLDQRSVVNPATKGRNMRYRIALKAGWKLTTTIAWDDDQVSTEDVARAAEAGGNFEGIGDGRRIGFGRFRVLSFKLKN